MSSSSFALPLSKFTTKQLTTRHSVCSIEYGSCNTVHLNGSDMSTVFVLNGGNWIRNLVPERPGRYFGGLFVLGKEFRDVFMEVPGFESAPRDKTLRTGSYIFAPRTTSDEIHRPSIYSFMQDENEELRAYNKGTHFVSKKKILRFSVIKGFMESQLNFFLENRGDEEIVHSYTLPTLYLLDFIPFFYEGRHCIYTDNKIVACKTGVVLEFPQGKVTHIYIHHENIFTITDGVVSVSRPSCL